ncbi:lipopolysaccharide biosynthesis protein [Bacteroidia bacterium]|nr:lipopolysaccharide biosynthesis protein [Bacteroidia bacterium]GHV71707.1 lipopolysaccharide biosynthesis protein [Bacteroidia bacterium]
MADSTLKQKTANGLLWGGINNGFQQLLALAFGVFMARILCEDDYGMVGMLAIFTGIASTIINSGFSVALTNIKDATHKDYNAVFWFTVFVGLALYLILFFCAPFIAKFYKYPELTNLSRFLFIGFLLGGIGTVSYTIMFKKLMTKQQAIIDMISQGIALSIGIVLALKGFAYWALATQMVILTSLSSLLRFFVAPWKPSLEFDFLPLKPMFSFSIKLFITNIFTQINTKIFSIIFGKLYGANQVGIYDQGQKWAVMGNSFIAGMINTVTQPILVQVNEQKDRQVSVLRKLIRFSAFISFPLMLGLAFVGREFIVIAIGEKWLSSVPFLQLFCIWGAIGFLSTLYMQLIFTHGKSDLYMYGTVIIGLLQLLVVYLAYPFGIFPMVIAYIAMNFVGLMIWQYYTSKLIGLRLKHVLKDILPYLAITLGCFFVAWLLTKNIVNLYALFILKILISGLLYVFIMKISNSVMFKESMEFLLKLIKK